MSSDVITAIAFPWYCVVSHGMDFYDLCWHHVMIIRRSHMQLYVNHCQSIFMLDHALSFPHLISSRWARISTPQISPRTGHLAASSASASSWACCAQHSPTWRTDTNQQFTFLQCQIPLSWITKSSLNSTANSHLSVPNLHRTAPLTFWSKAARTKVSLIRMNTAWKEELKRIKKKRKIKWELYGDMNVFRPLQLGYGAIWVQVDFNTLWNHTLRLLVLLSCQMLP